MSEVANSLYGFEVREPDKRRVDDEERKTYDIKQLWQRSHEIIGLALQGLKQVEIAKALNITPQCVSNTLNSTLGQNKLSEMREKRDEGIIDVSKRIAELQAKALRVYEEIFDQDPGNCNYELKMKAADTVTMELGGFRAPTRIDTRSMHFVATEKELEEYRQRGLRAARESGMLVDLPESKQIKGSKDETEPETT